MSFEQLVKHVDAAPSRDLFEAYYDGASRLDSLGVTLPPQVRVLEMVLNWPRLVVDSIVERMIAEGFRLAGSDSTDTRLWDWWQANNLDEESGLLHTEALVQGRGYVIVGMNADDESIPAITVHTGDGMATRTDPLTRRVVEAVRQYKDGDGVAAAHYLPDRTVYYRKSLAGNWVPAQTLVHDTGIVPVVPMVNRARIGDRKGRSEMCDVMKLTDAASRTLTNLQVAQEILALPQRYVVGASEADFQDANGNLKTAWESYIGRMLTLDSEDAKPGQFAGADLRVFTEVVNLYARQVSALSGLPAHFLGFTSENPASAEAIVAAEAKLVMRVRQRMLAFGESWERAMRCALRMIDGSEDARRLEIVWRNPATPTDASVMDAAIKGVSSRLLTVDQGRERIGMSAEQRKIAAEDDHMGGFLPGATNVGVVA